MHLWQALVLGVIEGVTEFLPVSSTGHLLVAQRLMGIRPDEASNAYAIVIQGGAIAAVLVLYRQRIVQVVKGLLGQDKSGASLAFKLLIAFLPAAVIGLLFDDVIERYLFGPWPVIAAWAAGGVLIFVVSSRLSRQGRPLEALTLWAALWVGLSQCAALWPGVSRSLATILAGISVGLSLGAAVEFSFLLGLLTLGAATAYKAIDSGAAMLAAYGVTELALGFVTAWLSAMVSVVWMVRWLQTRRLAVFGWWRVVAAGLVAWLAVSGRL